MRTREPVFNAPVVVIALLAAIAAVHGVRQLLSVHDDAWLVALTALIPARFGGSADDLPGGTAGALLTLVTHMMVHGDVAHLAINMAWLLAFGSVMARRLGAAAFLALFTVSGIAGGLAFLLFNPGLEAPMVGASGAISGLMGAAFRIFFAAMDQGGLWLLRDAPRMVRPMSLAQALADRRVQAACGVWLGLNLLIGIVLPGAFSAGGIAWEAHVGGFLAGFLLFGAFDRGTGDVRSSNDA